MELRPAAKGWSVNTIITVLTFIFSLLGMAFIAGKLLGPLDDLSKVKDQVQQHSLQIQSVGDKAAGAEAAAQRSESKLDDIEKHLVKIEAEGSGRRR
jgi:hypothetical protein